MAGSIFIPLVSVFSNKGIRDAQSGLASLKQSVVGLRDAAKAASASFVAVKGGSFVKETISSARDLERNMTGLSSVFETLTPQMTRYVKDAEAIGLSQVEASRATTFLGSVLKQSGFTMSNTARETKSLVGLASDLAATYGYDVSEALTGMTALFRGEYDPIEKFGVAMKQAEVNALLAARGQRKLTGESLRLATAQARLDLLYQRSADAQGAYARQMGTLFVAQKNLNAAFENTKAALGKPLQQPMATLLNSITPLVDVFEKSLLPLFESLGKSIQASGPFLAELGKTISMVVEAISPLITGIGTLLRAKLGPLTGALQVLNRVMKFLIPIFQIFTSVVFVLGPLFMIMGKAIDAVVFGLNKLLDLIESIPILNVLFKQFSAGMKKITGDADALFGGVSKTNSAFNEMTKTLSYKRPPVLLDAVGSAADDTAEAAEAAGEQIKTSVNDIIDSLKKIGVVKAIMGEFETEIVSTFDAVEQALAEAYKSGYLGERGLKNLKAYAEKERTILTAIAKRRDILAQQINKATEVQSSLMESAGISSVLDKTSNSIVNSITYIDGKFKAVVSSVSRTSSDIAGAFKTNLNKIRDFYLKLQSLSSMNLKGDLLSQIADVGFESGSALADSIIAGGQSSVDELNAIWDDIRTQAGNAGAVVGSAMEDSGITMGNGLIDGLRATQDELASLAEKLATTFAEKFKKKMQTGLDAAVAESNKSFNLLNAPEGSSVWGSLGSSTTLGKGSPFKFDSAVASKPSGKPMQGILGRLQPQNDMSKITAPTWLRAGEIFNPYRKNESFLAYQQFEQARMQAAQYNIEIKVAPTANAAQVGQALVDAISAYERTNGKGWRK